MRTIPACAALSSKFLWWDLLIDASQCWGNRLNKRFWESLVRTVYSVKNDPIPGKQIQDSGSANHLIDSENVVGKLSRLSDATCTTSAERSRSLFPEVHTGLGNMFGFAFGPTQERSMNSGVDLNVFASNISTEMCSRCGVREGPKHSSFGKGVPWDEMFAGQACLGDASLAVKLFEKMQANGVRPNKATLLSMLRTCGQCLERHGTSCSMGQNAALCIQSKSAIEAASKLETAFTEIFSKHDGLEEANFVIDNIYKQLSSLMEAAHITQKGSSYFGFLVDKAISFTHFGWMEREGSEKNDYIDLSTFKPFGRAGLVKFGMLLHNHVILNNLEANVCFWSALADLYAESGMVMDALEVRKSLENSLAVPFRALLEGCALPGVFSKCTELEGEQPNDCMNAGLLSCTPKGFSAKGLCDFDGARHFMRRIDLSRSSACLKEINGLGQSSWSASFRRAMSTSTEKQCDEDLGEQQQSPSQHQNLSQQQSSLEVPESKPQQTMSSWPNPDNAASYVLMSNIYADGDRWDEVKRINEMRLKARAWKKPGKAYVEIKAKVHEFIVGDRTHQDSVNIYEKLRKIKRHMGHIGYVPNVDLILENRSYYDPYAKR